jgi:hypothetical protein
MKFIQFIGTQRSGSNLLRAMLNQLPQITAPHPPHILKIFEPILSIYGDLSNDDNFELLVNDVCTWVELNPVSWKIINFDRTEIQNRCKENTLIELFYTLYAYYAELHNSDYACCKSMNNVHLFEDIEAAGIKPYYIYLHRDGRDVACSFKKTIIGEKHVYCIAEQWKTDQEKSIELKQRIPSNRFIEVNYRDLITSPKLVLKKVCSFLQVPFRENMLDYFHAEETINTAESGEMWKNLSQPIMSENYNKYLKELSLEEIELFESIAGDTLKELGYKVSSDPKIQPEIIQLDINRFNVQNNKLKNQAIIKASKHDIDLRCPQKELLKVFRNKLLTDSNVTNRRAV